MKEIRAVLFDLDGVIVDTERLHFRADAEVCRARGFGVRAEDLTEFTGASERQTFEALIARHRIPASPETLIAEKEAILLPILRREAAAFPDFWPFLDRVRGRFALSVTTSTRRPLVETIFEKLNLAPHFRVVVTEDDVARVKPHPEPYQTTMERLGVRPEEGVALEDSPTGVAAAKAAGLRCIALARAFPREALLAAGADETARDLGGVALY